MLSRIFECKLIQGYSHGSSHDHSDNNWCLSFTKQMDQKKLHSGFLLQFQQMLILSNAVTTLSLTRTSPSFKSSLVFDVNISEKFNIKG